ncbi:extracellular solute-binding protein [Xylanibacillus composti]|uniref:Sugar ABC transporter substrate-binding protein n=1 Tax=Xylanibacillus composti TaxID=1572762 RepID=A0A8J4H7D5_9BACL|nr:sugar ABC transporter substrate-binding protein [Xylanibacillus composti]MDT9725735.1 extracellular solute-binding protein [Xylanibacillus composti]GIQ71127.1 sugar ABC transporter substrate-binding protein [Xylanibacillus composti]
MKTINLLRMITAFLLLVLVTAACTSTPTVQNLNQTAEPTDSKTVSLDMWIISNDQKQYHDLLDVLQPYREAHPDIALEIKVLDWAPAWSTIVKAVSEGTGPDVLQLGTTWVPAIAAMDGLEELTTLVDEIGGSESFLPASWQTTGIQGDPAIYAIPWHVDARAVYYRTDVFEQAGIDPDEAFDSWESFLEALRSVNGTKIDGAAVHAFAIPGKHDWDIMQNFFPWIWGAGGQVLTADGQQAAFNSEAALEGILYYMNLVREGLVDETSLAKNSRQVEDDFADGKSAAVISGPWLASRLATPHERGGKAETVAARHYAIAPIPAGPEGRATFIGGSNLSIVKHSERKAEAWELIKYLSSPEAQARYAEVTGFLPARLEVLDAAANEPDTALAAFAEAASYGRSFPSIPQWGPIETTLVNHISAIWDMVASDSDYEDKIRAVLNDAVEEVNSILERSRQH